MILFTNIDMERYLGDLIHLRYYCTGFIPERQRPCDTNREKVTKRWSTEIFEDARLDRDAMAIRQGFLQLPEVDKSWNSLTLSPTFVLASPLL